MRSRAKEPLSKEEAEQKLASIGQEHLFSRWNDLDNNQKNYFLFQVTLLDTDVFRYLRSALTNHVHPLKNLSPYTEPTQKHDLSDQERGEALIQSGKCACLVLAGGMGSRLRFQGPKGCFPVSVIKKKSLYQLLGEKVAAAEKYYGTPLELAVMTSPRNHIETETFFAQHAFFGLSPHRVHIFFQEMWPLLDLEGNLFFEAKGRLALGPNGNGGALKRLREIGIWQKWKEKGIEIVNQVLIDNPLADPFDPYLIGFHEREENQLTIKAIQKRNSKEKVGVLALADKRLHVIEYCELDKAMADRDVSSFCSVANLSLYSYSMSFIEQVSLFQLPIHLAKKVSPFVSSAGEQVFPEEPNIWKCEQLITDVVSFAEKSSALVYPREDCYAPLKNYEGEDSISTVQASLQGADRKTFFNVSSVAPPVDSIFELDQRFYYPTQEVKEKWKGKELPFEGYIEAL